jgi:hypothetical protein
MMVGKLKVVFASALLGGLVGTLAGCQPEGPAERAGQSIDRGVQKAKDALDPAGPAEKAGRAVDRAVNPK